MKSLKKFKLSDESLQKIMGGDNSNKTEKKRIVRFMNLYNIIVL